MLYSKKNTKIRKTKRKHYKRNKTKTRIKKQKGGDLLSILRDFKNACKTGNLDECKRIFLENPLIKNDNTIMKTFFVTCCEYGQLNIAQWLLEIKPDLNISFGSYQHGNNIPFITACRTGHINILQWLVTIDPSMINLDLFQKAFSEACIYGHLELAQWLLHTLHDDINIIGNGALIHASGNGHLDIAQWLLEIKPSIMTDSIFQHSFLSTNLGGHLNVSKWLYDIKPTNSNVRLDFLEIAFKSNCESGRIEMAKWLLSINPEMDISLCRNPEIYKVLNADKNFQKNKLPILASSRFGRDRTKSGYLGSLPPGIDRKITEYL